ncbi:MAG: NADH:flavin oxidoreductase [archaeon]|nr:NADH:flavin oxidoreductase [archaeon]
MSTKFWTQNISLDDLLKKIKVLDVNLHYSKNNDILFEPINISIGKNSSRTITIPNRLVIHPMEGADGTENGAPSDLTLRRAERFGNSGAGLIWFEATSVVPEGRANPRQLFINKNNIGEFKKLIERTDYGRKRLISENPDLPPKIFDNPLKIIQLTHSGRYSRPFSKKKEPIRAYEFSELDKAFGIDPSSGIIVSDQYLDNLKEKYINAIGYAQEAGFDGVGIKAVHRYLISELLSGFTRKNSKYGGKSFENRTKILLDIIKTAVKDFPDMIITLRLNLYDGIPYPYGFGVEEGSSENPPKFNPTEPIKLLKKLHELGVNLVNTSIGNPYYIPYISRPYDNPSIGGLNAPEHPLKTIERIVQIEKSVKSQIPSNMVIIGTGFSWLRQLASFIAAGEIESKSFDMIGFGRMSIANPQFPVQIYRDGRIDHKFSCITCSKCTDLMRFDSKSGCVISDIRTYGKIYRDARRNHEKSK